MSSRRDFLTAVSTATAEILFTGCAFAEQAATVVQSAARRRREVAVAGRRVKTVDIHAHCTVPEVAELVKDYDWSGNPQLDNPRGFSLTNLQERLRVMDEWDIDVQAVSINPFWYPAERDLAAHIIKLQNEKLAEICAAHSDRFVGLASVALQYPYRHAQSDRRRSGSDLRRNTVHLTKSFLATDYTDSTDGRNKLVVNAPIR